MTSIAALYPRLPDWAQHVAVSAYGVSWYWHRFGPGYAGYLREYAERERWSAEQWRGWQQEQVAALLRTAAEHVPYYRRAWDSEERAAARAGRLDDLPLLEKEPLRADPEQFVRRDLGRPPRFLFNTSGTTNTPVKIRWTSEELRRSVAVREVRSMGWAGVSYRLPRATIGGRMVVPDPESRGPFYRYNLVERQVYFSPFHIRPDTAAAYVRALARHKIRWLNGLPVSFAALGRFILEQKLEVPPLLALVTSSEKVTPEMRAVMEEAFRCRVYEEYGCLESSVLATECEAGRLHLSPDVGILEILRPDGSPCEPGEVGEVVATSLLRTCQPLIRYRLGDMAAWDARTCPCGRPLPVLQEVTGRVEDVLVGPDGRRMVRFHLVFGNQPHVREGQIIQETLDWIRLRVVPAPGFGPEDAQSLVERARRQLGSQVRIDVEPVDHIPRTAAGKFRMIVSHLPSEILRGERTTSAEATTREERTTA